MLDFEQYTPKELAQGFYFHKEKKAFVCLFCGKAFAAGEIFPEDGRFFTPGAAVRQHVAKAHPDRLEAFLQEQKYLGLTDHQKTLLRFFAAGVSDKDAAARLGLSPSTVRHQRFVFREKAKAARLYLAMWSLVSEGGEKLPDEALIPFTEVLK